MRRGNHCSGRGFGAGLPVALAGSIALSAFASPAYAGESTAHRTDALSATVRIPTVAGAPTDTVQPGDTVTAISARHGLRVVDVLAWNSLSWTSIIQPGQVLRLSPPDAASVAASAPPAAPAAPAQPATYTVVAGDTMSAIARRHGVSTDALLAANGLGRSSIIYPGQSVSIPGAGSPVAAPAPAPAQPAPAAFSPPSPSAGSYVIVAGDTMSAIAGRHNLSTDALLAANGLSRASIIYPGQTLTVPDVAAAASPASAPVAAAAVALDAEQAANARTIIDVGRALGVSDRGVAIALATAMQESSLRNLDYGPDDSLGLFQQRPSTGWGTDAEVQNTDRATRVFFGGPADPNGARTRGLLDIPGWEGLGFSEAAQAVQVSAYPERYGAWEQSAYAWLASLG